MINFKINRILIMNLYQIKFNYKKFLKKMNIKMKSHLKTKKIKLLWEFKMNNY